MRETTTQEHVFHQLRDGEITFGEFARATQALWRRQASVLMRRWRQPSWVSREDVEQDMLFAATRFVWDWEPGRGSTLSQFVVWNAFDKAKKQAHKQRGACLHGDADSNPSRYERPLTAYERQGEEESDGWWEGRVATRQTAELLLEEQEREEQALGACASALERHVVRALRAGEDVEGVVDRVARRSRRPRGEVVREVVAAAASVAERMVRAA